ncbi:MAG TPA: hypothetical protein VFW44_06570 [Bryobacteraceae bacterium]|nr:hypothetical protein [Bryobacteraceae bacterium]
METPTTGYYGCETGKCLPMALKPGDPVVIGRQEGAWTCGYLVAPKGSAQGWVQTSSLQPIGADPNPPLSAWIGTWIQDKNHLTIKTSQTKLAIEGEAYWFGSQHVQHTGEISGEATAAGNRLHYEDGVCNVDFALIGKYLLANDNNMCGGVNVRFWGVWKRVPAFPNRAHTNN